MKPPLVTVFVPAYNAAGFVEATLDSVRRQTFKDFEFIVIDDCSTDATPEVIERWIEKYQFPCHFIRHEANQGLCRSMNQGVAAATGKYLAVLGSDDVWLPAFLETATKNMEKLPDSVAVLYSDAQVIGAAGEVEPRPFIERCRQFDRPPEGQIFDELLKGNFIPVISALTRLDRVREVGGYDESLYYEDYDMWLKLAEKYDFAYQPEVLVQYRRVLGTSMRDGTAAMNRMWESTVRIKSKWMGRSQKSDEFIRQSMCEWPAVRVLYSQNHSFAFKCGVGAFRREKRVAPLLMVICIALHVPYGVYLSLEKPGKQIRKLVRRVTPAKHS